MSAAGSQDRRAGAVSAAEREVAAITIQVRPANPNLDTSYPFSIASHVLNMRVGPRFRRRGGARGTGWTCWTCWRRRKGGGRS